MNGHTDDPGDDRPLGALKLLGQFVLAMSAFSLFLAMLMVSMTPTAAVCERAYQWDGVHIEWTFSKGCWTSPDGRVWTKHGTSPWENVKSMVGMKQVPDGAEVVR
jgi:hypothetical protein